MEDQEAPKSFVANVLRRLASAQTLGAIPPPPEPPPMNAEALWGRNLGRLLGKVPPRDIETFDLGAMLGRVESVGEANEAFFRDHLGQLVPAIRGQHLLQWDPDGNNYRVFERKTVKRPETFWDTRKGLAIDSAIHGLKASGDTLTGRISPEDRTHAAIRNTFFPWAGRDPAFLPPR